MIVTEEGLGNRHYDPATYQNSVKDSLETQRDIFIEQIIGRKEAAVASPIKVFTVCINAEIGTYIAFLGSDPTKKATAGRRELAVARLLAEQKLIVMTEID